MRILIISNVEPEPGTGSGYIVANYSCLLSDRGHDIVIFGGRTYALCPQMKRGLQYRLALGSLWLTLRQYFKYKPSIYEYYGAESWLSILLLRKVLRTNAIVVIHSNGIETHYATVEKQAIASKLLAPYRKWYQFDQSTLFHMAFKYADGIVTVSEWDAQYGRTQGYGAVFGVKAIDNPLPDKYLGQSVTFSRDREIGFCGNWISIKGIDVINLDIVKFLRDFRDWRFTIVGVGESFRKEDHFQKDVLAQINVVPFADRESELMHLYHRFAVLIMPSIYESFGLVAAEAMACGCPVIGTRVGFLASLKDEEEALLMDNARSPSLYSKLVELAENEKKRQAIARGGYNRVQSLKWDVAVKRLETIYQSWIAAKH